jgi:hypothetical protein
VTAAKGRRGAQRRLRAWWATYLLLQFAWSFGVSFMSGWQAQWAAGLGVGIGVAVGREHPSRSRHLDEVSS